MTIANTITDKNGHKSQPKKAQDTRNKARKKVGIVQTGSHGEYVGKMLVDLIPGKGIKILDYELIIQVEGTAWVAIPDLPGSVVMPPGSVALIPPGFHTPCACAGLRL